MSSPASSEIFVSSPQKQTENTQNPPPFQPVISPQSKIPEFTLNSVLLGIFFVVLFGTSSVYLALCSGFPVGGSIPISVILIGVFKRLRKSTILENNLIQTIGSAGESIASGTVFTLVALLFIEGGTHYFYYTLILILAAVGGIVGVLFMLPLRRSLIVQEHKTLLYPEGTACADILIAGEHEEGSAKPIFTGALSASIYWILMRLLGLWKEFAFIVENKATDLYKNASFSLYVAPEYLGIGYLIGPRVAFQILLGGLFASLVLVPLFSIYPELAVFLKAPIQTGGVTTADQIQSDCIQYIAVGAVVGAGFMTLFKTIPVIVGSFRNLMDSFHQNSIKEKIRTEKELPIGTVLVGGVLLVLLLSFLPNLPGKFPNTLLVSFLILIFGFFFVTVASRFAGVAGYSIEPTSAIMITTVMATCLLFILLGWTSETHQAMVVLIGSVVCIAANHAGATSQDLKTGFLLGATPYKQQIGVLIGVIVSSVVVSGTIILINHSIPSSIKAPQAKLLATLVKMMLGGNIPWRLFLIGIWLAIIAELSGAIALSIAAGLYFPLSITVTLSVGAFIRWLIIRNKTIKKGKFDKGMLFTTGLVAGGALTGMLLGFFKGFFPKFTKHFNLGMEYWSKIEPWGNYIAIIPFLVIGVLLYREARK